MSVHEPDRHTLWRMVHENVEILAKTAPEGFEPHVQIYLAGREAPLLLGEVATTRNPDNPFTIFLDAGPRVDGQRLIVVAHESHVMRVEIRFEKKRGEHEIGFTHRVTDDPTPSLE